MRKRIVFIVATVCILLITGCGASNSAEDPVGADNQMVENVEQTDKEENDEQYDSQTDLIYNNGLPYGQPMNFDTGGLPDAYVVVIQEYCRTGMFPDGQDGGDIPGKISYAVYDVDGDGKDELILKNQDTITAGMTERVYAYEDGVFREEFCGFPALTYYDNGLIQAEWSHNQGNAGDRLWPYTLYQYQPDDDSYIMLEAVDAWDKELADSTSDWGAFPDDIDADGDGYIYFLLPTDWEGQYSRADIVDNSDYENWRNHYLGGAETLEIPYQELEVETVFPDAAG